MNESLNILVIDDDKFDRMIIQRFLKKSKLQVNFEEALTMEDGLKKIKESSYHCVISDNNLPDGTGLDILDNLSIEDKQKSPIIILTGGGNEITAVKAIQKGAVDYIPKDLLETEALEVSLLKAIRLHELEKRSLEAEKALIKKEAEYRTVLELVPFIIMKLDDRRKISYANQAVGFLGYNPENLIGKNIKALTGQEMDETTLAHIATKRTGKRSTTEVEVSLQVCPDSTLYDSQKRVQALIDSRGLWSVPDSEVLKKDRPKKLLGSLIFARNLTEQKKIEKKLRESQKKLEDINAELEKLSNIDGLTGIANRYCFDEYIINELKRTIRDKTPVSLIMVDIDYFKNFNDRYGHLAGDECLKDVAKAMKNSLNRPSDIVARYGGEEFVVVLPGSDKNGAAIIAEKIRSNVESLQIKNEGSAESDLITVSLGVYTIKPDENTTVASLISKADQALYQAKNEGRNRVVVVES